MNAYEVLFKTRSDAMNSAIQQLKIQAAHPQALAGYKRASELLNILGIFLVRDPDYTQKFPYIMSRQISCISWSKFKQKVVDLNSMQ